MDVLIGLFMLVGAGYVLTKPSQPPKTAENKGSCPFIEGVNAMSSPTKQQISNQ